MIIYKITNKITGKVYIGQTVRTLKERWWEHSKPVSSYSYLTRSILKYGKENFQVEELKKCNNIEELNYWEEFYIKELNTLKPFGYNLATGGLNKLHSEETKQKMSKWHTGKIFSEQTKLKMRKPKTEEHKQAMRKPKSTTINMKSPKRKPIIDQNGTIYESMLDAAKQLNLNYGSLWRVLKGEYSQTKGYTFKFLDS